MLKIATYNIKNKTAKKFFCGKTAQMKKFLKNIELIEQSNPDIVGLQEVTKEEYALLGEFFKGKYKIYGGFRGSIGLSDEACPIMVKENLGIVADYGTFSLSDDITKPGKKYLGSVFPRIATYVHFVDDFDDYMIINTHVDNLKYIQRKTFDMGGPLEKILFLHDINNRIIMGDMNTKYDGFLEEFCLRNFLDDATIPLGNTYKRLNTSLDHILYDDSELVSCEEKIYTNSGSDHPLIMTKISKKRS